MQLITQLLDAVLPDTCVLCEGTVATSAPHHTCPHCWAALPRISKACRHCALPLAQGGLCGTCLTKPLFSGTCVAALLHQGSARLLVHRLKYNHGLREGSTLASALQQAVAVNYSKQPLVEAIIPVPLSYWRQVQRGFNQAAWLAHLLGKSMQVPVITRQIRRSGGAAQKVKNRRSRLQLPPATFDIQAPINADHVAIVDDVLTTGATAKALTQQLRNAGVKKVDVWCATRTPSPT
jgi:ComF family protein